MSLPDFLRSEVPGVPSDDRTVVLSRAVDADTAGELTRQLLVLDREGDEPIRLMVTSAPGGEADAACSLYDVMQSLDAPVTVIAGGTIRGAALLLIAGADEDHRLALPNVYFQFDEPTVSPTSSERPEDVADRTREIHRRVVRILAEATGQSGARIRDDLAARITLKGDEAIAYGLVSRIISRRQDA